MLSLAFMALHLVGCGGDKETPTHSGTDGGCDAIASDVLGAVPATEWDANLGPAMEAYDGTSGRWTAQTDCGVGEIGIKLVAKPREELNVVTELWQQQGLTCGCVNDTEFGDDTAFGPIALFTGYEFYVETFDDPGVQGQNVVGDGALFGADDPFDVRSCGRVNIDPILNSHWDQLTTILRVDGGALSGTIVLATDEGEVQTCTLSGWTLVEAL